MWLYGVAFSLSFWFFTLELSLFIQILPLLVAIILSILYAIMKIRSDTNPSVEIATVATAILFVILFWTKPEDFYYIFSIVFAIIVLITVIANAKILFVAPPAWMGLGNALSMILTTVIYLTFYATIQKHIENYFVLIPIGILSVVEMYIILNIQHMPSLCDDMKERLRADRVVYFIALIIAFVTTLMYTLDILPLDISLMGTVIAYSIGLIWSTSSTIWRTCKNTTDNKVTFTVLLNQEV